MYKSIFEPKSELGFDLDSRLGLNSGLDLDAGLGFDLGRGFDFDVGLNIGLDPDLNLCLVSGLDPDSGLALDSRLNLSEGSRRVATSACIAMGVGAAMFGVGYLISKRKAKKKVAALDLAGDASATVLNEPVEIADAEDVKGAENAKNVENVKDSCGIVNVSHHCPNSGNCHPNSNENVYGDYDDDHDSDGYDDDYDDDAYDVDYDDARGNGNDEQ